MEFGLISITPAEPIYVRWLFPISALAGIVFIFSILKSLRFILAKRREPTRGTKSRNLAFFVNLIMLILVFVFLGITCHYFSKFDEAIRQYVTEPGGYEMVKEVANAQFRLYLSFAIPSIVLGLISLTLLKRTI
jgi:hypothetical protein